MRRPRLLSALLWALCPFFLGGCNAPNNATPPPLATADPVNVETLLYGDEALKVKLRDALRAKGPDYVPRTKHKTPDGAPKHLNRLILETSPYLVQHAHNPVNWFPWGDEAFALAKQLKRPVFLSVGYATCHWCHVMEEESFEDEEVATFLNDHYIAIKVDREERPDVDAIYMRAVQLLTSRGGWPMSVWLTHERKPFYAGTYFPARDGDRGARKGFLTLLLEQRDTHQRDPEGVTLNADQLVAQVQRDMAPPPAADLPNAQTVTRAAETAARRYDATNGGAMGRPKFPSSFPVRLLLRHGLRAGDKKSTGMAIDTLRKMQAGGVYDHVGGGFHRYSVDDRWLVPHFEKMLYDNALLALAYLDAVQQTRAGSGAGDADFERVSREILDYVAREMTAPGGAYFSATDADSLGPKGEREEGYYFTWTPAELGAALGETEARAVLAHYAVTEGGNFEGSRSILHTPRARQVVASELDVTPAALTVTLEGAIQTLRAARKARSAPILDDKIQVGWCGLMIAAMARGYRVLNEPRYLDNAIAAATFLTTSLVVGGRLRHSYKDGRTTTPAFAEDYAFLAGGLIELFEASQDARWLAAAVDMMHQLEKHHSNPATGGYFRSASDAEKLLTREVEQRDGAIPSAASWALMSQLRLWTLTADDEWRQRAEATMRAHAATLRDQPWMLDETMLAVDFYTDSPKEVVLVLPDGMPTSEPAAADMLQVMQNHYVPNHVFVLTRPTTPRALAALVPWAADKPVKAGRPTAYVCERGACDLPTNDPQIFAKQVTKVVPYPTVDNE